MDEKTEMQIKTLLLNFIRKEFVFEGDPQETHEKSLDITEELYQLIKYIKKSYPQL